MNIMRVSITTPFVRTRYATNLVDNSTPPRNETDGHLPPELSCRRHHQGLTSNNNSAHRTFGNQCRAYIYSAHTPVSSSSRAIMKPFPFASSLRVIRCSINLQVHETQRVCSYNPTKERHFHFWKRVFPRPVNPSPTSICFDVL